MVTLTVSLVLLRCETGNLGAASQPTSLRPTSRRRAPPSAAPGTAEAGPSLRVWLLQPSWGIDDEKPTAVSRAGYCFPGCARLTKTYILRGTLSNQMMICISPEYERERPVRDRSAVVRASAAVESP
jgi:hypothetical protein